MLRFEKLWLKDVRYQVAYGLREKVMGAIKTFIKYRRVKSAIKMNRYSLFMVQLARMNEQSRLRQAQALVYY